ncbi:MAG: DEAD/DEAH box helicase, partial [bacterium]
GETRPSLVVCPASLVYNWREECKKFTPALTVETLDGTLSYRKKLLAGMGEEGHALLYITSYDLLKRDIEQYDGLTFGTIALDEAQYVKNQRTAVSKAVRVLKAEHRFALTGTPIENRLAELWSIFDFLMPGFLYSSQEFASRFETPIMKQKDPAATERLSKMTEPFILRRKKADVLKDLPEKLEETRASAMEPDQRRLYDAEVVRMKELLAASDDSGADKMRILAEITRLRQLCCDPSLVFENYEGSSAKRVACLELIQNAIDAGHRMLVFSQFTSMLALLADDLTKAGISFFTITGSTPKQERLRLVNEYNAGDTPVFLISLKAGGTGLNLTGADVVIHYDPWWNLAVQNQATDRAHRIGQTRQVTVIRLIAAETIEEKIVQLQEAKRELAETIISGEGGSLMSFTREELLALLG